MRRVLLKMPGSRPEERQLSTAADALEEILGCPSESHYIDFAAGITLICAHQETARARNFAPHIWRRAGTIAGPVILARKTGHGYVDLQDDEIARWSLILMEFSENSSAEAIDRIGASAEKEARRIHSTSVAFLARDEMGAILRLQVELEQRIRETWSKTLAYPERLGKKWRADLPLLLGLAAASNAMPADCVELVMSLGELRNRYAHEPGFAATLADIEKLRGRAPSRRPYSDLGYIYHIQIGELDVELLEMSAESQDLRALYSCAFVDLEWFANHSYDEWTDMVRN